MPNETTNAVDVKLFATEALLKPISTEGVRWLTEGDLPLIQAYWWADVEPWTLEEWHDLAAQGYRYTFQSEPDNPESKRCSLGNSSERMEI